MKSFVIFFCKLTLFVSRLTNRAISKGTKSMFHVIYLLLPTSDVSTSYVCISLLSKTRVSFGTELVGIACTVSVHMTPSHHKTTVL